MIGRKDVIDVAKSIRMSISDDHIDYVMRNYESCAREDEIWHETVEGLLYSVNDKIVEDNRPNPMHYEDSPKGDAQYWDDYWGGNFDAMAYHDDIGDR